MKTEEDLKGILEDSELTRQLLKGTSRPIIGSIICDHAEALVAEVRRLDTEFEKLSEAHQTLAQERDRLALLLNTPEIHDFAEGVKREAAHQRKRWGIKHDEGKSPEEWLWLVAYLTTKATQANRYGDREKYLHHIITAAAACANWHSNATGKNLEMRPGVDPAKYEKIQGGS